jgi:hypothetical protein
MLDLELIMRIGNGTLRIGEILSLILDFECFRRKEEVDKVVLCS